MTPATLQILILLQQFLQFFPILVVWIFLHVLKVIVSYGIKISLPKIFPPQNLINSYPLKVKNVAAMATYGNPSPYNLTE
jgi:hypothetical protein